MLDRKNPPLFSKEFSFTLPKPEVILLKDDLSLVWIKDIQQEVIKLDFIFKAGKWYEPKTGVSYFTSQMLDKGTENFNSQQIASRLDQLGAQLEISSGADFTSVSLFCLSRNFEKALAIIFDILVASIFPEDELNLMVNIFSEKLKVNNEKNSFVASKILNRNIFGKNHPYGRYVDESDLKKINIDELKQFFKDHFTPHEVYLTGNLSQKQYSLLTDAIRNLPSKKNSNTPFIEDRDFSPSYEKMPNPKSIQSAIRFGKKTVKRNSKEYPGVLLLNHILGGYFGSRLMKNIREKKGLTYGIHSSVNAFVHDSMITIATETNKDKLELSIDEIIGEIQSLLSTAIPHEELEVAKSHFLGNLQLEISNPFSVIEKIKNIRLNNLELDYYQNLFVQLKRLSIIDLQSLSNNLLSPKSFHLVSVG